MAYRRKSASRARSTSRGRASRPRTYRSRSTGARRSTGVRRYGNRSGGVLRIEVVSAPATGVSRPEMMGLKPVDAPATKPKF